MKPKAIAVALIFLLLLLGVVYALLDRERPAARSLVGPAEGEAAAAPSPVARTVANAAAPATAAKTATEAPETAATGAAAGARFVAGTKALREQRYADAAAEFREALREDPDNPMIHLALATACEGAKDWENAYRSMKTYARLVRAERSEK